MGNNADKPKSASSSDNNGARPQIPVVADKTRRPSNADKGRVPIKPRMSICDKNQGVVVSKRQSSDGCVSSARRRSTIVPTRRPYRGEDRDDGQDEPFLTAFQKGLLVRSWNHHSYRNSTGNENIGVRIYVKLFERCPEVKGIFGFNNMTSGQLLFDRKFNRQSKLFVSVIDNSVKHLDELDTVVEPALFALGGRHIAWRERGFKLKHWDYFAEAMLECIIESQGLHQHRDTTATWRLFITWMIAVMREGYDEALRQQRRSTVPAVVAEPSDRLTRNGCSDARIHGKRLSVVQQGENNVVANGYDYRGTLVGTGSEYDDSCNYDDQDEQEHEWQPNGRYYCPVKEASGECEYYDEEEENSREFSTSDAFENNNIMFGRRGSEEGLATLL